MKSFYREREFDDAVSTCGVGELIYQKDNPTKKYGKNHPVSLYERVPKEHQKQNNWVIFDPKEA